MTTWNGLEKSIYILSYDPRLNHWCYEVYFEKRRFCEPRRKLCRSYASTFYRSLLISRQLWPSVNPNLPPTIQFEHLLIVVLSAYRYSALGDMDLSSWDKVDMEAICASLIDQVTVISILCLLSLNLHYRAIFTVISSTLAPAWSCKRDLLWDFLQYHLLYGVIQKFEYKRLLPS